MNRKRLVAKRKATNDSLPQDRIPHDENSVDDNESIGRGLKRKSSNPAPLAQPSPPKQTKTAKKDPLVTIGHVLQQGKKSVVIPQEVSQSTPQIFQKEGFVTIQKGTKKPKGKGFSKGNHGEETVIVHKSIRPKRNQKNTGNDDFVYDVVSNEEQLEVSADDNASEFKIPQGTKKRKTIGRQPKNVKRVANQR